MPTKGRKGCKEIKGCNEDKREDQREDQREAAD